MPVIELYIEAMQTADNSDSTKKMRLHHMKLIYDFLGFRGVEGISGIDAKIIADYALSLQGSSMTYAKHRMTTLRNYFRFILHVKCMEHLVRKPDQDNYRYLRMIQIFASRAN